METIYDKLNAAFHDAVRDDYPESEYYIEKMHDRFMSEAMYHILDRVQRMGVTPQQAYEDYMAYEGTWGFEADIGDVAAECLFENHDSGYLGTTDIFWKTPDGRQGEASFDAADEEFVAILWYRYCLKNGLIETEYSDEEE